MASIPTSPTWSPDVTQIETTDAVLGGPDGVINVQAQQLADRTDYLKQEVEAAGAVAADADAKADDALAQIAAVEQATGSAVDAATEARQYRDGAVAAQAQAEAAKTAAEAAQAQSSDNAAYALQASGVAQVKAGEAQAGATVASFSAGKALEHRTAAEVARIGSEDAKAGAEAAKFGAEAEKDLALIAKSEVQAAAAAAAAIYDQFDDRYLGDKAIDPVADNDGNALQIGALYWNTTSNQLRVYGSSGWQAAPATADNVSYTPAGTGAVATTVEEKLRRDVAVSVSDYFPAAGTGGDDTLALETAAAAVYVMGGGVVKLGRGKTYRYTRLHMRSGVVFEGEGSQSTFLVCTDPTKLDAGITIGSSIRKADDGQRVYRAGFRKIFLSTGSAGTAANQATYQKVIGINLCACERTIIEDCEFAGFGQGALVFARAEAGAEGLGFVNTTQDGNYNVARNISIAGCGAYNSATSAIWFKYKANSNKFYGVFGKGIPGAYLVGIDRSNDNAFFGGTLESGVGVANIGFGTVAASGNCFFGIRIEGASGDGYMFGAQASNNTVIAGYHTGVTGLDFNLAANPNNRVISDGLNWLRNVAFPPSTNYSVFHNLGALRVTSINGDPTDPLYIKSKDYATVGSYPYLVLYNDIAAGAAGNVLGRIAWRNGDSSTGASGVSGAIEAVLEGSGGNTGIAFHAGTGTTLTEFLRLTNAGVLRPATDNTQTLGAAANRWSVVYAGTGTINTSDEREKQDIAELDVAEKRVAVALKGLVKKFRFRDAVSQKGDDARIHIGVIAQDVMAAFAAEGLDAGRYGIICYDEWDEQVIEHEALFDHLPTGEIDEAGEPVYGRTMVRDAWTEVRPAGSRYGVRYEELMAFIIAAL